MTCLGCTSHTEIVAGQLVKYADILFAKCDNVKCYNFTTCHDLAGSWCSISCFNENEFGFRPTKEELKQLRRENHPEERRY